ncbi:sulfur reduction protein DsrE [Candidatus Thorarchaeota archaeon]|jgi:predicted peroxiredoxin|nr:MAG: sulfur reduction protein DsrE [Candidatus Thorarchaeota archaeon]
MPSLYIIGQWGPEAAERCYGPFVTGTTAQAQDVDATIFLMMDAVMLMKKGSAEKIKAPGFPPLPDLIDAFLEAGGKIQVCSNSVEFRGIEKEDLRDPRIEIAGAATMIDETLNHDRTMFF